MHTGNSGYMQMWMADIEVVRVPMVGQNLGSFYIFTLG